MKVCARWYLLVHNHNIKMCFHGEVYLAVSGLETNTLILCRWHLQLPHFLLSSLPWLLQSYKVTLLALFFSIFFLIDIINENNSSIFNNIFSGKIYCPSGSWTLSQCFPCLSKSKIILGVSTILLHPAPSSLPAESSPDKEMWDVQNWFISQEWEHSTVSKLRAASGRVVRQNN